MKYVVKRIGAPIEIHEENELSLERLQSLVEGYIEPFTVGELTWWVNEEGKLIDLPVNCVVSANERLVDTLNGTIVIARYNDEGDAISLTDEDIEDLLLRLDYANFFTFHGDNVIPIISV